MRSFFARLLFLVGFLNGFFLAVLIIRLTEQKGPISQLSTTSNALKTLNNSVYQKWFASTRLVRKKVSFDVLRYSNISSATEAKFLHDKVRVLCLILVRNAKNAEAAKNTWTKGCNAVEFVGIEPKTKRKIWPIRKTKQHSSWVLLCKALLKIKMHDWVVFVNDNTFVILENLRHLVAGFDYNDGHYFGHAVTFWTTIYNTGQAGYVLSWGSIEAIRIKFSYSELCTSEITYLNQEDMYLGKHLASLNITAVDTRDSKGFSRFYPHNWNQIFFPSSNMYKYSVFPVVCCSALSITFQVNIASCLHVSYLLEFLLGNRSSQNLHILLFAVSAPDIQRRKFRQ